MEISAWGRYRAPVSPRRLRMRFLSQKFVGGGLEAGRVFFSSIRTLDSLGKKENYRDRRKRRRRTRAARSHGEVRRCGIQLSPSGRPLADDGCSHASLRIRGFGLHDDEGCRIKLIYGSDPSRLMQRPTTTPVCDSCWSKCFVNISLCHI